VKTTSLNTVVGTTAASILTFGNYHQRMLPSDRHSAYDSNFCFDIWRVTNADYLLTYLKHNRKNSVHVSTLLHTVKVKSKIHPQSND